MDYKDKINNVAIYLRKSRNNEGEETEATLQKHRNRLLEIAVKNGWKYELFQEIGSSMNENRPEYVRMNDKLQEGIFDAVLSVNLARVTRSSGEAEQFMKLLRKEDILFITDSERIYNLEETEDYQALNVNGFLNNWDYENIKSQLRKGKKDSAKMGRWSNGTPNFGYVYNRLDKVLEIKEAKAEGVRLAFQLVIDGMGVDNVAIELNKAGYRTNKGNFFHGHSIKRMIVSEIYKGWIVSNRVKGRNIHQGKVRPEEQWIVRKGTHPAIIDEETWNKANESLQARKQLSPRAKQRKHGLSSIIKCVNCGKAHAVTDRKDRKTPTKVLQPCKKKNGLGVTCSNRGFNYNAMMDLFISRIAMHKDEIASHLANYKEDASLVDTKAVKLDSLSKRIKTVKNALDMLQIQLEEGLIDIPAFKDRKRLRNEELAELEKEYNELADTTEEDEINAMKDYVQRLDKFLNEWDSLEEEALNRGLLTFIDKAVWNYPKGKDVQPVLNIVWR